jgi:hypothetical protein
MANSLSLRWLTMLATWGRRWLLPTIGGQGREDGRGPLLFRFFYCRQNYEDAGVIMISPSSTSPKFTDEGGWNVHRVCGRDDAQGAFAGRAVAKAYAGKNIAILDDSSVYGVGLAAMFKSALNGAGVTEKVRESYKAGANDYNDLVQKMLAANVDLIYLGGYALRAPSYGKCATSPPALLGR